jgi:hypothetical protein
MASFINISTNQIYSSAFCLTVSKKKCPNNKKEIYNDKYRHTRDRLFGLHHVVSIIVIAFRYGFASMTFDEVISDRPDKIGLTGKFFIDFREKKRKKIFRKYFRFHSRNKRKLFVQFQFGLLLELRMTSSKVIEANQIIFSCFWNGTENISGIFFFFFFRGSQ